MSDHKISTLKMVQDGCVNDGKAQKMQILKRMYEENVKENIILREMLEDLKIQCLSEIKILKDEGCRMKQGKKR